MSSRGYCPECDSPVLSTFNSSGELKAICMKNHVFKAVDATAWPRPKPTKEK